MVRVRRRWSFGCRQDSDAVHVRLPSFRQFHGCHASEGAMWTIGHPNSVVARIQNAFSMSSPKKKMPKKAYGNVKLYWVPDQNLWYQIWNLQYWPWIFSVQYRPMQFQWVKASLPWFFKKMRKNSVSHEKKTAYFPLYWLFNRGPYNGLLSPQYIWVV